jgi:hypothetical protein
MIPQRMNGCIQRVENQQGMNGCVSADINNDKRPDLVCTGSGGVVRWYENMGVGAGCGGAPVKAVKTPVGAPDTNIDGPDNGVAQSVIAVFVRERTIREGLPVTRSKDARFQRTTRRFGRKLFHSVLVSFKL